MTAHSDLVANIRLAIGKSAPHARMFLNPVGEGWAGQVQHRDSGVVTLCPARRITFGLAPGSADLVGWTTVTITPDMVGRQIAVFTSGEVKPAGSASPKFEPEQPRWLAAVQAAGGFADVLRSKDDALRLVKGTP